MYYAFFRVFGVRTLVLVGEQWGPKVIHRVPSICPSLPDVIFELLTSLTALLTVVVEAERLEFTNLIELVFYVLDDSRCSVFYQIVHTVERLKDTAPVLGF